MSYLSEYYTADNIINSCEYYLGDNWWDHFYPEFVVALIYKNSQEFQDLYTLKLRGATQKELYCHPVSGFGVNFAPDFDSAPSGWTEKIFYINCCLLDDYMSDDESMPEGLRIKEYGDFFDQMEILGWENA